MKRNVPQSRLITAMKAVYYDASQNTCTCNHAGSPPVKHDHSCFVYLARKHYKIVSDFITQLENDEKAVCSI